MRQIVNKQTKNKFLNNLTLNLKTFQKMIALEVMKIKLEKMVKFLKKYLELIITNKEMNQTKIVKTRMKRKNKKKKK
jgi:hypothetical protein